MIVTTISTVNARVRRGYVLGQGLDVDTLELKLIEQVQKTFGIALVELDRTGVQAKRLQQDLVSIALFPDVGYPVQHSFPAFF